MKGRFLLAAALVLAAGCSILEDDFIHGSRREVRKGDGNFRPGLQDRDSSDNGGKDIQLKPDTVIFCSAVRCPDDYDWQRDTACNTAACEVILYRNGKEILCIPAGRGSRVSPAPDLHHIIDGHLYTEYCTLEETVICRDGEEILRFKGNEILKGLVPRDNHIFTLAKRRDGTGYTYRDNGEVLLAQGDITVFGGFDNPSYPETGALYLDGDDIVFCYRSVGVGASFHSVVNRQAKSLILPGTAGILDIKIAGGKVLTASANDKNAKWTEANVITGSRYAIAGTVSGWAAAARQDAFGYDRICKDGMAVYCSAEKALAVHCNADGSISVHLSSLNERKYEGAWHLFTTDCCAMVGDELLVGLSPKERGGQARLCLGAKTYELEGLGNGFITGVAGTISLPSSGNGNHPPGQ